MTSPEEREKIYTDDRMNQGINTDDSIRNISEYQCSDVDNVRMGIKGGIYSANGKTALTTAGDFGQYLTCRGGIYMPDTVSGTAYNLVAQDNGAETAIFAVNESTNVVTQLLETTTENSLSAGRRVFFTFADKKCYWKVEDETSIYEWDGSLTSEVTTITAVSGTIPTTTKIIASWKSRLWVGNDASNKSEATACAYRDYDHWNTAVANASGDKAYQVIPEARQDEQLMAFVENAFDTLLMLRERSVFVIIGDSETNWSVQPLTVVKGCVATKSAVRGNQSAWFLSQFGVERITGSLKVSDSNSYDSLISSTITADNQDLFDAYTATQKADAFAIVYKDTYRLNIAGDVWLFDILANKQADVISNDLPGALTKVGVENDVACYMSSNEKLYGMGSSDGILYQLDTGDNDNGSAYDKYYITKDLDFDLPRNLKNLKEVRVFGYLDTDYDLFCDVYLNGAVNASETLTFQLVNETENAYYAFDSGNSSSVVANTLNDDTKAWVPDAFIGGYLKDGENTLFQITDNDATSISVVGNPSDRLGFSSTDVYRNATASISPANNTIANIHTEHNVLKSEARLILINQNIDPYYNTAVFDPWNYPFWKVKFTITVTDTTTPNYLIDLLTEHTCEVRDDSTHGRMSLDPFGADVLATFVVGGIGGVGANDSSAVVEIPGYWFFGTTVTNFLNVYSFIIVEATITAPLGYDFTVSDLNIDDAYSGYQTEYSLLPNQNSFYTLSTDSSEQWASSYKTIEHISDSGSRIALRGNSIRLKFYNSNADEPWEIYKFQVVYEVLKHTSPNDRN